MLLEASPHRVRFPSFQLWRPPDPALAKCVSIRPSAFSPHRTKMLLPGYCQVAALPPCDGCVTNRRSSIAITLSPSCPVSGLHPSWCHGAAHGVISRRGLMLARCLPACPAQSGPPILSSRQSSRRNPTGTGRPGSSVAHAKAAY
eukprot:318457-Chlamydomonas_euryale.AAC.3